MAFKKVLKETGLSVTAITKVTQCLTVRSANKNNKRYRVKMFVSCSDPGEGFAVCEKGTLQGRAGHFDILKLSPENFLPVEPELS